MCKSRQWLLNDDGWQQLDWCAERVLVTKVSAEERVGENTTPGNGGARKWELNEEGKISRVGEWLGKNRGRVRKTLKNKVPSSQEAQWAGRQEQVPGVRWGVKGRTLLVCLPDLDLRHYLVALMMFSCQDVECRWSVASGEVDGKKTPIRGKASF